MRDLPPPPADDPEFESWLSELLASRFPQA